MSRSAKNDKTKTNVMRLLDAAKIPYESKEYLDEHDLPGAMRLTCWSGPRECVLRLVLKGERTGFFCLLYPGGWGSGLKKAAKRQEIRKWRCFR